ncbi:MAG: tRNA pseudouridine(54/55) synthase Pus10 [Methanosarcinaceae archaeon]|nr:tRNA pseudouridine(54/55) synthase Pus10 [Methanosarcinaceae archaeon]
MNILETAERIVQEGPICDHCMGRQFAKLSTGLSNDQRGRSVKLSLVMDADRRSKEDNDDGFLKELAPSSQYARNVLKMKGKDEKCWVCLGLFEQLDEWAERAVAAIGDLEYSSFLVGTLVSGLLAENEEILWAESGTVHAEQLKSELNREVGKRIAAKTGKDVDLVQPDIVVTLDLTEGDVTLQIRSVYLFGRYRKLVRGIPQTRWPCRNCRGRGCEKCNFTGKQYPESVDELIREPVIQAAACKDTKFHGAGREDIDAKMLGTGRPFVVEAVAPAHRSFNVAEVERQINEGAAGKVEIEGLSFVSKDVIETIKTSKADKVYNLKVTFSDPVPEEILTSAIGQLVGAQINQRTPQRVSHRRADLVRKRQVHGMELIDLHDDHVMITVHCEGGLYVKELISGDEGRTVPSLTDLINIQATVLELDVVDVKL